MTLSNSSLKSNIDKLSNINKSKLKVLLPELVGNKYTDKIDTYIDELSDDEYNAFIQILKEASVGSTKTIDSITYEDYEEIPVDIDTFICDPRYLGRSTGNGDNIYPYWREKLRQVFDPDSQIVEFIESGAIGLGKTTIAVIGVSYILYKLLCLRSPATYYNLMEGSKIAIAIFNIDLSHGYGQGYSKLQTTLKLSPWFIEHGTLLGRGSAQIEDCLKNGESVSDDVLDKLTYNPGKDIHILVGSRSSNFTGFDVFAAFLDEMNFYEKGKKDTDSVEEFTQLEVMKVYTNIKRRIESRFMMNGTVPGIIFMVSSKKSEHSALELYANKVATDPHVLISDEPIWKVKNYPGRYCGVNFKLVVGDKYNKTKILGDDEDPKVYTDQGRRIIDVPIEHKQAFELDADQALTDIAGIAIVSGGRFIDASKYTECISKTRKNAFTSEIIVTDMYMPNNIYDYFDIERIPYEIRILPMYLHIDGSKNNDKSGIGLVAKDDKIVETTRLISGQIVKVKDIRYKVVGATSIKNSPGMQIPYRKFLDLAIYLRSKGLKIVGISMDTFQSLYLLQDFTANGFNAKEISMDRTPVPYRQFRTALYENRIELIQNSLLENEFTELLENKQTGRVDHPDAGSKDAADGVTGAMYNASISFDKTAASYSSVASAQNTILDEQLNESHSGMIPDGIVKDSDMFDEINDLLKDY
jgi:hypothetical protein